LTDFENFRINEDCCISDELQRNVIKDLGILDNRSLSMSGDSASSDSGSQHQSLSSSLLNLSNFLTPKQTKLKSIINPIYKHSNNPISNIITSSNYKSKETLLHNQFTIKSDFWALGVASYKLYSGKVPFDVCDEKKIEQINYKKINLVDYGVVDSTCNELSREVDRMFRW